MLYFVLLLSKNSFSKDRKTSKTLFQRMKDCPSDNNLKENGIEKKFFDMLCYLPWKTRS